MSGKVVDNLAKIDPALVAKFLERSAQSVGSYGVVFVAPDGRPLEVPFRSDLSSVKAAPGWISKRMQSYGDDVEGVREFGADIVANLCRRLLDGGAPSLHFYTLNLAKPTQSVLSRL